MSFARWTPRRFRTPTLDQMVPPFVRAAPCAPVTLSGAMAAGADRIGGPRRPDHHPAPLVSGSPPRPSISRESAALVGLFCPGPVGRGCGLLIIPVTVQAVIASRGSASAVKVCIHDTAASIVGNDRLSLVQQSVLDMVGTPSLLTWWQVPHFSGPCDCLGSAPPPAHSWSSRWSASPGTDRGSTRGSPGS